MRRGDLYSLRCPKGSATSDTRGIFGVIVQSPAFLPRSLVVLAPTSTSARPATFRPVVDIAGTATTILVEHVGVVDVGRLRDPATWRPKIRGASMLRC